MANYVGEFFIGNEPLFEGARPAIVGELFTGTAPLYEGTPYGAALLDTYYMQRVYDTTAGWCHYTTIAINPTPLAGDTTPNHTNNLLAGAHVVLRTFDA